MSFKRRLKKEINSITPNQIVLNNIRKECGIETVEKQSKPRKMWRLLALPVFACLMLAVVCSSIVFALPKGQEAYVLVEMNPKVEFVAKNDTVIKQRALNKEAQVLLLGTDYCGDSVASAIKAVVRDAESLGLIAKGDSVCISMVDTTQIGGKAKNVHESSVIDTLGKDFQLTTSFSNKNDLVKAVANKCDVAKSKVENKSVDKLIAMYANYDETELMNFSKTIAAQINGYRAELDLNLKCDQNLADCEKILDLLHAIKYNLLVYNNGQTDELCSVLEKYVALANTRYDNVLQDLSFDANGVVALNALIDDYESRCQVIETAYTSAFETKLLDLKLRILAAIK